MIVDAHHHVWTVARGDYGWMSPDLPIARDYGLDLNDQVVRVRMRQKMEFLLADPTAVPEPTEADLLALFDGSLDADAAFFARSIQVEGDVGAVMALHNALESTDLRLVDLLPLPAGHATANAILTGLLRAARHRPTSSWA